MHIQLYQPIPQIISQNTCITTDLHTTKKELSKIPLHLHVTHIPHLIQLLHNIHKHVKLRLRLTKKLTKTKPQLGPKAMDRRPREEHNRPMFKRLVKSQIKIIKINKSPKIINKTPKIINKIPITEQMDRYNIQR